MKYILINDIRFSFKNKKIMVLAYILIIIFFALISKILKINNDEFIAQILGICLDLNDNYIYFFAYVLNISISISIYLSILLFTKDISLGKENIFLRSNYQLGL